MSAVLVWLLVIELRVGDGDDGHTSPIVVDSLPTSTECVRLATEMKKHLRGVVTAHCFEHHQGVESRARAPLKVLT